MKSYKLISWKESIALVLCIALFISSMQAAFGRWHAYAGNKGAAANDINITYQKFELLDANGNAIDINDNTRVKEGQRVRFVIRWSLENTDNKTEFSLDLQQYMKLENLTVANAEGRLTNDSNEQIGTYTIKDGILTYHLDGTIEHSGERTGGARFDGEVETNLGEKDDGTKVEIAMGAQKYNVIYDANVQESSLGVSKWNNADGKSTYWDGDNLYQNFTVQINAWNGKVTLGNLSDTFGNGLTNLSAITIKNKPASLNLDKSYPTISSLANALNGKELANNQSIQFTYSMKVDSADIMKDSPVKTYNNKLKIDYTNNKNDKKSSEAVAWAYFNKPMVGKSGAITEDGTKVLWTITINLNDLYQPGKDLSDYIKKAIEDIPGYGNADTKPFSIPVSEFKGSNGEYRYVYETDLSDEFLSAVSSQNAENTVKTTINNKDYSVTGYAGKAGKQWFYKEVVGYNESSKIISWKVTLQDIPKNVTDFVVRDDTNSWYQNMGKHTLIDTISIKNGSRTIKVVDGGKVVSGNGLVTKYEYGAITFDNTALKSLAGKNIEINYQTKIDDANINNKNYRNLIAISYKENGKQAYGETSAVWKRDNAIKKQGSVIQGRSGVHYTVTVDLSAMGELKAGQNVVLKDTMSKDMKLDKNSIKQTAYWRHNEWYNETIQNFPEKVSVSQSGNVATFTMKTTKAVLDMIAASDKDLLITIEYDATLTDKAALELLNSNGSKKYSNSVEGTYGTNPIGDDYTENQLTPQKLLRKSAVYDQTTAPNVEYSVDINPEGFDLADGDTLTLEDEIGSALSHNLNSIKLQRKSGSNWLTLQNKIDYRYSYDQTKRTITITVPDATPLRLSYEAKVIAHTDRYDQSNNEKLTPENAYNTIRLKGMQGGSASDSEALNTFAITPSVWADGESVTITKYWNDEDGSFNVLPGAEFALYRVAYNNATGAFGAETLDRDDIKVNQFGMFMLSKLKLDQVYALYETKAPDGFEKIDKPYYFVIPGSSGVSFKKDVNKISYGYPLRIENKKQQTDSGKLIIKKTIKGEVTQEEVEAALGFSVTDTATGMVSEFKLKNFEYNAATREYTLTLPRSIGDYVVRETQFDIFGCTTESVSYSVNGGAYKNGNTVTASVKKNANTTVTFEDAYKKISTSGTGHLIITKTIEGAVTPEEAEKTLQFKITNNTTGQTSTVGLNAFDYNEKTEVYTYKLPASACGYTVEETVYNIDGFTLQSVTYQVNGGQEHEGRSGAVDVEVGKDTTIAFEDAYIKKDVPTDITKTPSPTKKAVVTPKPTRKATITKKPSPTKKAKPKKTASPKKKPKAKKTPKPTKKVKKTKKKVTKKKVTKKKVTKKKVTKKKTTTKKKKRTVKPTATPKKSKTTIKTNSKKKTGTPTNTPRTGTFHNTPKTGDETRILFYMDLSMMGVSAMGIVAIGLRMRKRKRMWTVI